jgi:energy-coupling factor transport system permease protein
MGRGKRKKNDGLRVALRYVEGDSLVHRLDPRAKLLMIVAFGAAAILTSKLTSMAALFAMVLLLVALSGIGGGWLRSMTKIVPFLVVVIILDALFPQVSGGHTFWAGDIWFLHPRVTFQGILYSITMGLQLLSFFGVSTLFIMTTKYEDFVKGLRKLKVPPTFSFSMGLSLRAITYLASDVKNIMEAQRSRGLELDQKNFLRNYNKLLSLFIPMIICLLLRSRNISEAMQARKFGHVKTPTMYRELKFRLSDFGFLLLVAIVASLVVYV